MKLLLATLVCVIAFGCASAPTPRTAMPPTPAEVPSVGDCTELVKAASAAIDAGKREMAKKYLKAVLSVDPEHAAANCYLRVVEEQISEEANKERYSYPLAKPPAGSISI